MAKEAEASKHFITARNNYFAAALEYGASRWSIWEDNAELVELNSRLVECYKKYAKYADHPVIRVDIPFEGHKLHGYLHLPSKEEKKFPTIVHIGGMDGFKEQQISILGDRNPMTIAAAAVYTASLMTGENKRQSDCAEAAGVAEVSLRGCGRMIRRLMKPPVPGPHTP